MKIVYNNIIPFKGYKAINLFGILFVRKGARMSNIDINHESIHSEQMKELLFIPFYIFYVIEWIFKLIRYWSFKTAYYNISFEKEAYLNECDLNYLKTRKRYSWKDYLL